MACLGFALFITATIDANDRVPAANGASSSAQANQPAQVEGADGEDAAVDAQRAMDDSSVAQVLDMLRQRLDALVTPAGWPAAGVTGAAGEEQVLRQIEAVAAQAVELSRSQPRPTHQAQAMQIALRAYHALARQMQQDGQAVRVSFRLLQMRNLANQLRALDTPHAAIHGDHWLMLIDLADILRNPMSLAQQRQLTIERMEQFLAGHGDVVADDAMPGNAARQPGQEEHDQDLQKARMLVRSVQQTLLRHYHDVGRNRQAAALARQLPDQVKQAAHVKAAVAASLALQRLVTFELTTIEGETIRSADAQGQYLLIHARPAPLTLDDGALQQVVDELRREHGVAVRVVHLVIYPAGERMQMQGASLPPMVLLPSDHTLLRQLGITALPAYVLLDGESRVAALGHSPVVAMRAAAEQRENDG